MNIRESLINYYHLTLSSYEPSTNEYHKRMINHLMNACDWIGIKNLKKVTIDTGYQIINYLKQNTLNHNNSINKILNYLEKVMRHHKIITTYADLPRLPKDTRPFQRFFDEDLKLIMQYTKGLNSSENSIVYKTFIRLLLDSGLRVSEALSIKIHDIDCENNVVSIYAAKTRKYRLAPFSNFSKSFILDLINKDKAREYLFHNFIKDRPMIKGDIKLFYRRLKKKLNLQRIHTHRFRKTFASILIENGLNIDDLQKLFDHSRIETTINYVQHSKKRSLDEYKKYSDWGIN